MKIYISADIEGIGCVSGYEHSSPKGREYAFARKQMTAEVNAAARGAFDAGASEVVVADAHNIGLNLIPDELDERISVIMGSPRPLGMMECVDMGFDAAFLIGYHAMAGTPDSSIAHIYHSRIAEVNINGRRLGEIGLSAALAGHFGVPVALVSSDQAGASEADELLGKVETVVVKKGIGAYAGICLHPKKSQELVYHGAQKALSRLKGLKPLHIEGPITLEVRFTTASSADRILRMPGTERKGGATVRWQGQDVLEAYKAFNTMADLVELVPFI